MMQHPTDMAKLGNFSRAVCCQGMHVFLQNGYGSWSAQHLNVGNRVQFGLLWDCLTYTTHLKKEISPNMTKNRNIQHANFGIYVMNPA